MIASWSVNIELFVEEEEEFSEFESIVAKEIDLKYYTKLEKKSKIF